MLTSEMELTLETCIVIPTFTGLPEAQHMQDYVEFDI
jgi:hypothetical protein